MNPAMIKQFLNSDLGKALDTLINEKTGLLQADTDALQAILGAANPAVGDTTTAMNFLKLIYNQIGQDDPVSADRTNVMNYLKLIEGGIGGKTDIASSTGSVHAKLNYISPRLDDGMDVIASNTIRASADTARSYYNNNQPSTWCNLKSITVPRRGVVRVSFDIMQVESSNPVDGQWRLQLNGVTVASATSMTLAYVTQSRDVFLPNGGTLTLDVLPKNYYTNMVRNFRVSYDPGAPAPVVVTN